MAMQSLRRILISAAFVGASTAMAADTANLNVSAEVQSICSLDATDYNFAFGVLDPAAVAPVSITQVAQVMCTAGTAYTITPPAGPGFNMTSGANTLPYTLTLDGANAPISATASGVADSYDLEATIQHTDFNFASGLPVGVYTDVQILSVNP